MIDVAGMHDGRVAITVLHPFSHGNRRVYVGSSHQSHNRHQKFVLHKGVIFTHFGKN